MWTRLKWMLGGMLLVAGIAGCGSGSDGAPPVPGPAPAPTGIGPAGGTVTGPNGATVVVPAGALSQTVDLRIEQVDATARLPEGLTTAGAAYALTPHGTSFAQPVTVTIPFDPAQVPGGDSVQLLKTTNAALTEWAPVPGATVAAGSVSAPVTSFSDFVVFVPRLPTITTQPAAVTVAVGQNATFTVAALANGLPPLTYQWQRNSANITGANSSSYTLPSVVQADEGALFSVVVGNGLGTVTSTQARLTVGTALGWMQVGPDVVFSGARVSPAGVAVSDMGRVLVSYTTGPAVLGAEVRVSEWDGSSWQQLGGVLNLDITDAPSIAGHSVAYDQAGRPLVAWLEMRSRALVVMRWTGTAWERLGDPVRPAGATTSPPRLTKDPLTGRLLVTLLGGPVIYVHEWDGTNWTWRGRTSFTGGAELIVLDSGLRLLSASYGTNFEGTLWQARLYSPDNTGQYESEASPEILPAPVPQNQFSLSIATDGGRAYAAFGDGAGGQRVARLNGAVWETVSTFPGAGGALHITRFGIPVLGGSHWWDGKTWHTVPAPVPPVPSVTQGTALGYAPNDRPHMAIAHTDPANPSSTTATQLRVYRFEPAVLSVTVAGPAGSGSVGIGEVRCEAGNTCNVPLPVGTTLALNAQPSGGHSLQSWVGCTTVVDRLCTVNISGNQSVTATFQ